MRKSLLISVATLGVAAFLGAADAHAFTIENYGNNGSDGGKQFTDPDEQAPIQRLTDPKTGESRGYDFSGTHFNFSVTREPSSGSSAFGPSVGSKNYFDPSQPPPFPNSGFTRSPFWNNPR